MIRNLVSVLLVGVVGSAWAQEPEPKIVVVPYPGEVDAGVSEAPPTPAPEATPAPGDLPSTTRTIEAVEPPPPTPPSDEAPAPGVEPPPGAPSAFLDGHPREGAFLSGPGSLTFVMHHAIMGGVGLLSTQMVPRVIDSMAAQNAAIWTNQDARIAYLAATLLGAGLGFGASAWWQFTHWMNTTSASAGIITSLYGAMFFGGMTDIFTRNASAISWLTFIGSEAGGWLLTILGGGDLPLNKGLLVVSGGAWAAIYTALICAVVVATGGGANLRAGLEALMITPAIGAATMAAATLKFNPSSTQIMRANIFGVGVGSAVLLLSALVLGANFGSPVPYVLSAVGAVGAKTVVSLLWAEAAETPAPPPVPIAAGRSTVPLASRAQRYRGWW